MVFHLCVEEKALNHKQPAIVLLGPTGSGKTPLGAMLEQFGFHGTKCAHFDFGQNLRRVVQRGESDGVVSREDIEFLRGVLERNVLLEDKHFPIAQRVLQSFLRRRRVDDQTIVVMNGLPRHIGQAQALATLLEMQHVILLQCSYEVICERIARNTGGDRSARTDDDITAIKRKLEIYAERTAPLVSHFRRQGAAVQELVVTATMTAEDMWRRLSGA